MSGFSWWVVHLSPTLETVIQVRGESPDQRAVEELERLLDDAQRVIDEAGIGLNLTVRDIGIDLVMGPYGSYSEDV
jgi:hypothetical protein